jgi:hypothetical protein
MATQASVSAWEGAYITAFEFGITGFGTGLASGYAGGTGSVSDMFKQAGIGFGISFVTGAVAGATHALGWQDLIHGQDFSKNSQLAKGAERVVKLTEQGHIQQAQKLANALAERFGSDGLVNEAIQAAAQRTGASLTVSNYVVAQLGIEPLDGAMDNAAFIMVGGINPIKGGQAAINAAGRSLAKEAPRLVNAGLKEIAVKKGKEGFWGFVKGVFAIFRKNISVKPYKMKVPVYR